MVLFVSSEVLWNVVCSKARPGLSLSLPQAQALAGSLCWKCLHCEGGSARGGRGERFPELSFPPAVEMLLLLCATALLALWSVVCVFKEPCACLNYLIP